MSGEFQMLADRAERLLGVVGIEVGDHTGFFDIALRLLYQDRVDLAQAPDAEFARLVAERTSKTEEGSWQIGEVAAQELAGFYAVAALLRADRDDDVLTRALATLDLIATAEFILSRASMRDGVSAESTRQMSLNGAKGGRPPSFSDADLSTFLDGWDASNTTRRGMLKAAAHHFGVWDKAISKRLLKMRNEPT